jgi:D-threo-aldose 1-dehydrogenase
VNRVSLPGTGRSTTQLGFGCAYIAPGNAKILDAAYDAGIRHFDVARSYGRGLTEGILGRFLRRHDADVTVTSKYGIIPPFSHPLHAVARTVLKPIVRRLRRAPGVNRRLDAVAGLSTRKASFRGAEMRASLALSLRNLKLDRVDVFLMHEPEPGDLAEPDLLEALNDEVRSGKIGAFGVGGKSGHLERLKAERASFCDVLQYEWNALQPVPLHIGAFPIAYRVHSEPARQIRAAISGDTALRKHWSDEVGLDLGVPGLVERLLLRAALSLRTNAIILFSATQPEHVLANARIAAQTELTSSALRLVEIARAWLSRPSGGAR